LRSIPLRVLGDLSEHDEYLPLGEAAAADRERARIRRPDAYFTHRRAESDIRHAQCRAER
jgi:hypothetical protein